MLTVGSSEMAIVLPHTLTNETNADATQVNGNFAALVAALEGTAAASSAADVYQAGVLVATDWAVTAASGTINGGTGALSYPNVGGAAWLPGPSGALVRTFTPLAAIGPLKPPVLPGPGGYLKAGIEITASGGVAAPSVVCGAEKGSEAEAIASPPAVSLGKVRLHDFVIHNTAGVYSGVAGRDRRPWARGANVVLAPPAGAEYEVTSEAELKVIDAANLQARVECTGVPLTLAFSGSYKTATSGTINFLIDGVQVKPQSGRQLIASTVFANFSVFFTFVPTAGSHLFAPAFSESGGAMKIKRTTEEVPVFQIFETLRPSASNGTT